ncbi:hypothetical protein ACHAQA_006226 [Verticillium albo-atrum]
MVFLVALLGAVAAFITPVAATSPPANALIQLGPDDIRNLTSQGRALFAKPGIPFFDLTGLDEPPSESLAVPEQKYPTKLVQQRETRNLINAIDQGRMLNTMETLVDFNNRYYLSADGVAASDWIWKTIKRSPGAVKIGRIRHDWPQNSVEVQISDGRGKKKKTVIVGAHLDSMNGVVPEDDRETAKAPGANDNASGVAVLLEALYLLLRNHHLPELKNRVIFQFYAAEEVGLKGSLDIFDQYDRDNVAVAAMLNQDMAGFVLPQVVEPDHFTLVTDDTYEPLNNFLKRLISEEDECGYACSDHAAATKYGFPAAYVTHGGLNQTSWIQSEADSLDKVRLNHMAEHVKLVLSYVFELGFADL